MDKISKQNLIILFGCLLFFLLYSFSAITVWWPQWQAGGHLIFNWPDANANYFFAKVFAEKNNLFFAEPLNQLAGNLLHTRSINVVNGYLVPVTFLPNLLIFGLFFKLLGGFFSLLLIPFLASLTVYIIYRLLGTVFKDWDLAWWTAWLLFPLAPWLYFANIVMLPNILFIFLVCLAAYLLAKKKYIVSTLFLALALVCRPSEAVWILLSFALVWFWQRRQISPKNWLFSLLIGLGLLAGFFWLNKLVYGGYLTLGYFNLQTNGLPTETVAIQQNFWGAIKIFFLPFGFDGKLIVYNFTKYFLQLYLPYVLLCLLGLGVLLKNGLNKTWRSYIYLATISSVLLFVYYGAWDLADPLVKNLNIISSSYVRYYLPVYIIWLPLAALALNNFLQKKYLNYLLIVWLALFSIKVAFYEKNDGLIAHLGYVQSYYAQFQEVKKIAPIQAVLIVEREDKIFFPYYRVAVQQPNLWPRLAAIKDQVPIYYFSQADAKSIAFEETGAQASGLEIGQAFDISGGFKLYKIELKK